MILYETKLFSPTFVTNYFLCPHHAEHLFAGKKMAKSRNLPGVTKSLMWVRLGGVEGNQENCIELLDSPGIIPARQLDQEGNEIPAI